MGHKSLRDIAIKDADKGEVSAVFSTLNVVDKDGDVTPPGAFKDGQEVVISAYGHTSWGGTLPVGKGVIRETATEAILDGKFFMDTKDGRDTFIVVKELSESGLGEWSYGYEILESSFGKHEDRDVQFLKSLDVFEVSPVLRGAGVDTRTLATKGLKYSDEAEAVLAAFTALIDRTADVMAKRADKGKGLGAESSDLLARVKAEADRLAALLTPEPEQPDLAEDVEREFLRFVALAHDLG